MSCLECTIRTTEDCVGEVLTINDEKNTRVFKKHEEFPGYIGDSIDGMTEIGLDNGDIVRLPDNVVEFKA